MTMHWFPRHHHYFYHHFQARPARLCQCLVSLKKLFPAPSWRYHLYTLTATDVTKHTVGGHGQHNEAFKLFSVEKTNVGENSNYYFHKAIILSI